MSENIRQKRLTILEYFDGYICHHYQTKIIKKNQLLEYIKT